MGKKKKTGIIAQVRRPVLVLLVIFILLEGTVLFAYIFNRYIEMRNRSAWELADYTASVMQEYSSIGWLAAYWHGRYEEMEYFYSEEVLSEKEQELMILLPEPKDVTRVTPEEADALGEDGKRLLAEVCYGKLSRQFDRIKESYEPLYLYSFEVYGNEEQIFVTGTLKSEKRISEGGELFELGSKLYYEEGMYPVLDEILRTQKSSSRLETSQSQGADSSAVHVFAPVYDGSRVVIIVGVSLTSKDLFRQGLNVAIMAGLLSIALFLFIIVVEMRLLEKVVVRPIIKEKEIIQEYERDKDSGRADAELAGIKTNNEIESLAESFSLMIKELERYFEEVKTISEEKERIAAELDIAGKIQEDMLPRQFPPYPERKDFEIYASMDPAREVGGDFYDLFLVNQDHMALVIADVSGKGVPAALFMAIAKSLIHSRTMQGGTPDEILRDVNDQLCRSNKEEFFVTVWFALLELSTGDGYAVNAGHEHPALKRAGGSFELVKYAHDMPMGTMEGMSFRMHAFHLDPGDVLFVYTDGVPEAADSADELYGTDRMLSALNGNRDKDMKGLLDAVKKDVDKFVGDAVQADDLTMLAFGLKKV